MKFQNPILKFARKDGQTDKPKAICPFNFSKDGGITKQKSSTQETMGGM